MRVCVYEIHQGQLTQNHADARRYFKQSEIVLFRQAPEGLTLAQEQNKLMAVP